MNILTNIFLGLERLPNWNRPWGRKSHKANAANVNLYWYSQRHCNLRTHLILRSPLFLPCPLPWPTISMLLPRLTPTPISFLIFSVWRQTIPKNPPQFQPSYINQSPLSIAKYNPCNFYMEAPPPPPAVAAPTPELSSSSNPKVINLHHIVAIDNEVEEKIYNFC